jgi:hypothetical protein
MTFISIDPGLDEVGVATWLWTHRNQSPANALCGVHLIRTPTDASISDRLRAIARELTEYLASYDPEQLRGIVMEKPARGGIYRRSEGRAQVSIMANMYHQNLAAGAIVLACGQAGFQVELLEAPAMKKETKQAFGLRTITAANLELPAKRRAWSPDEKDAVAVGLQAMRNPTLRHLAAA